jgi:hypothetical protein
MKKVLIGTVERTKIPLDKVSLAYASVLIPGMAYQITAPAICGPCRVEAVKNRPVFVLRELLDFKIFPGDQIAVEINEMPGGRMKVVGWGMADDWNKAQRTIQLSPRFRVLRGNRFKGQIMAGAAYEEIVFQGTLKEAVKACPRDGLRESTQDKFAALYRTGPVSATHQFQISILGSDWLDCADPRPFPDGPKYRVMYWKDGKSKQLAYGTALQINWTCPRGENDPFEKYKSVGESNGYLYFEKHYPLADKGEPKWSEVADPRPEPKSAKQAPVGMPKLKKKEFGTSFKGFDQLALA